MTAGITVWGQAYLSRNHSTFEKAQYEKIKIKNYSGSNLYKGN